MRIVIPSKTFTLRTGWCKWAVLPLLALALMFTSGGSVAAQEGEAAAGSTPNFTIATVDADGAFCAGDSPFNKCRFPPGAVFSVLFALDKLAGAASYTEFTVSLHYSSGLTRLDAADECAPWPDGGIAAEEDVGTAGGLRAYWADCVGVASTDEGLLATVEFQCPPENSKETIAMVHGTDSVANTGYNVDTFLVDGGPVPETHLSNTFVSPALVPETLVINCQSYFPWDVHGPNRSANLDGYVDLPNDILGVILHYDQYDPAGP